jgi:hypothetical protein
MNGLEIREAIGELNEEALFIDGLDGNKNAFDEALVGPSGRIGMREVATYQIDKVINILMKKYKMTELDAFEWFDYNIAGSYVGENSPIFLHNYRDEE